MLARASFEAWMGMTSPTPARHAADLDGERWTTSPVDPSAMEGCGDDDRRQRGRIKTNVRWMDEKIREEDEKVYTDFSEAEEGKDRSSLRATGQTEASSRSRGSRRTSSHTEPWRLRGIFPPSSLFVRCRWPASWCTLG